MLILSLAIFTVVAFMGAGMALDVFGGRGTSKTFALVHGGLAAFASALVIFVALQGDTRLYVNIALAVAIIAVGVFISLQRAQGKQPRLLVLMHGGTAVACYLLLAYYALA